MWSRCASSSRKRPFADHQWVTLTLQRYGGKALCDYLSSSTSDILIGERSHYLEPADVHQAFVCELEFGDHRKSQEAHRHERVIQSAAEVARRAIQSFHPTSDFLNRQG